LKYLFPKTGDQIDENLTSFFTVLIERSGAQTRHLSYRGHTFGHRSKDNILEDAHDCFLCRLIWIHPRAVLAREKIKYRTPARYARRPAWLARGK
jgi:hypothetical protein